MGTFIQRTVGVAKEIEQDVVHAPQAVATIFEQKIAEPVFQYAAPAIEFIEREVIKYVEVPITVEKEVIKFIDREVRVVVEVPTYITKEIEKLVEVPVEIMHHIDRKVVTFVDKVPTWAWMTIALETLAILVLIIK